jgi:hypothetical protein
MFSVLTSKIFGGERATARAISRLQDMPRDAIDPADLCAQADAILQQGGR